MVVVISCRSLWTFFAFSVLTGSAVSACTSSFMDMDVIVKRAEWIPDNNVESSDFLDRELRVVPDWNFTCNSTITSLLLGVDIITGKTEYPEVQTWRRNGNQFTRIDSRMIVLSPGNFSASGVFQYHLTTPIPVVVGDMIGVYQPRKGRSVVRIYYKTSDPGAPDAYRVNNSPAMFSASTSDTTNHEYILLSAITDIPQCSSNFLTYEAFKREVLEANINDVVRRVNQLRIFPDISFTCSGNLTKWIVAGEVGGNVGAELQIWRRSNVEQNTYTLIGSSVLPVSISGFANVYNYTPNPPLEFQEGDILGVYQRGGGGGGGRVRVYYQETTGPANYRYSSSMGPPLSVQVLTGPSLVTNQYDYPLVTVEIATSTVNVTPPGVSTTEESIITSATTAALTETVTEGFSITSNAVTPTPATTSDSLFAEFSPSSTQDMSSVLMDSPFSTTLIASTISVPSSLSNTTPIVVAIVVVLVAAIIAICAVILIVVITKRKGAKEDKSSSNGESIQLKQINPITELVNPVYDNAEISPQDLFKQSVDEDQMYETPGAVTYEQPISTTQWGLVVPTMSQRKAFTDLEGHYEADEERYSRLAHAQVNGNQGHFFEEEVVYWTPGSDCVTIYEQLAQKRFREIARDQVEIWGNIGSGQFGSVEKGVWHSPGKSIDVALKTLRDDASEEEKVKFLQEAAIMGQFHHPNIVKLHGVVTVGEPTMIVLELVKNGDLRACLCKVRPIPGEMAPSSLPHQLLGYCRQIASGMEYLSKKSFVHRDLAARNILVDDERTCKIADFGLSRDVSEDDVYVSHGGMIPIKWTAPEAIQYKKYSTASDVWSFGVLMYEIWSLGHKPFESKTNHQVIRLVDSGYRLPPPPGCPRSVYQIMIDCWHAEASERPSFVSLVSRLSQPENQLLKWTDKDKSVTHPQSTMLGAPLETASDLHSDLQQH